MPSHVTRIEIADSVEHLFTGGSGADRQDLLSAAAQARPEIRQVLEQLPERRYTSLRRLWEELPLIPVGL
ncbi:DUF2795 domain-containing protein [Streptomyces sp. URMC 125]|uniref:DUF2795 domain-containing protein n=1 Tax=Streptomyces sp. URMC 125 TaxID=3423419 RepID=UPI003F1A01E7